MTTMELTDDEIYELRLLTKSALEIFINQVALENPEYADYLYRVSRATTTKREVAEFFGIAVDTVDLWNRKGMPNEGKFYCLEDCAKWLAHQKIVKVGDEVSEQIKQELQEEKLKTARLERQKKDGTLINRDDVMNVTQHVFALMQSRIQVLHKTYGDDVIETWSELLEECLDSFRENFSQVVGDAPAVPSGGASDTRDTSS